MFHQGCKPKENWCDLYERDLLKKVDNSDASCPYQIVMNDIEGRYLEAARNIKQGELILEELPLLRSPDYSSKPVCLGCYATIPWEGPAHSCSKCGWPMCSKECEDKPDHMAECAMFVKQKMKVNSEKFKFDGVEPQYDVIGPLRALYLKEKDVRAWSLFWQLMSHLDNWQKRKGWVDEHEQVINYIRDTMRLSKEVDERTLLTIFGISYTNDFSVNEQDTKLRLVFALTSMLSHDCSPNASRFIHGSYQDNKLQLRAMKDIPKGHKITITYVDTLWPTIGRQKTLQDAKHFKCQCKRCKDPTELKTNGSTLLCEKCGIDGLLVSPSWQCHKCKKKMKAEEAEKQILKAHEEAEKLLGSTENWLVESFEMFLAKYGKMMHPNNMCLVRIKNSLAGFYGRLPGYQMLDMTVNQNLLERKNIVCQETLKVIEILEPHISTTKGILQYELHLPVFMGAQLNMDSGEIDPYTAKKEFQKALDLLKQATDNLQYCPEGSFENQLYQGALGQLAQLEMFVQSLW